MGILDMVLSQNIKTHAILENIKVIDNKLGQILRLV